MVFRPLRSLSRGRCRRMIRVWLPVMTSIVTASRRRLRPFPGRRSPTTVVHRRRPTVIPFGRVMRLATRRDQSTADVGTTLADTTPPGVPAGVGASATSSSSITVSWRASTDDVAVTAYEVYRGGSLAGTVNAPGLSFVDGGRTPSTAYAYTVRARDATGNASPTARRSPRRRPRQLPTRRRRRCRRMSRRMVFRSRRSA